MNGRLTLRGTRVVHLRSVFSPLGLTALLFIPVLFLYVAASDTVFAIDFESRKTLSWSGFAYFTLALLLFAAGAAAGERSARRTEALHGEGGQPSAAARRSLAVLVEAALVVSIAAYTLWFALGVIRAGGLTALYDTWRDDPHLVKEAILTTIPGVTTLTQLAVAAVPLAIAFGLMRRGGAVRLLVVLIFVLAGARAVLFNERLAIIELVVPLVFLIAWPRKVTVPRVVVYGLVLLLGAMTFFAATELRRTYVYTNDFSPTRSATRFFGYYLTSVNNGMMVVDEQPASTPFYSTGELLWRAPLVGDLRVDHFPVLGTLSLRYGDAFGVDPEALWPGVFADQGLDYEFNVFGTPGYLAADFGWAGLVGVLILGLASGYVYRRGRTSQAHRALYAVWLVGLLEFMRIFYFTNTRLAPAYLVFVAAFVVLRRDATRRSRAAPSRAARSTPGSAVSLG